MMHARDTRRATHRWIAIGLALFTFSAVRAAEPPAPASVARDRLIITGSLTLQPLVSDIARRFEELHPGVKIEVQAGGSAKAQNDVRSGNADIGMIPRALRGNDRDLFAFPIARDALPSS